MENFDAEGLEKVKTIIRDKEKLDKLYRLMNHPALNASIQEGRLDSGVSVQLHVC